MLVIALDHERLAASPYHGALVGDEAILVHTALGMHLHLDPETDLPEDFLRQADRTLIVITLDEVGLNDLFVAVEGALDADVVSALASSAGASLHVGEDGEGRIGPIAEDEVEAIGVYRPSSGLAFGPLDREEEIAALLSDQPARSRGDSTLRRVLSRTPNTTGARAFIANTRGLAAYLRETFAAQNLTTEIVDTLVGVTLELDVDDGATLELSGIASTPEAVETLADQLDELIAGAAEQPLLVALGIAAAIEARERTVTDDEARFVFRMSDTAFRAALVRMMGVLASAASE